MQSLQYVSTVVVHATATLLRSGQLLHGWQLDAAECVLNVPCVHGVELVAPSRLNEPGLEAWQAIPSSEKNPAGHGMHVVLVELEYSCIATVPLGQSYHIGHPTSTNVSATASAIQRIQ
jgi:hypothetical protein